MHGMCTHWHIAPHGGCLAHRRAILASPSPAFPLRPLPRKPTPGSGSRARAAQPWVIYCVCCHAPALAGWALLHARACAAREPRVRAVGILTLRDCLYSQVVCMRRASPRQRGRLGRRWRWPTRARPARPTQAPAARRRLRRHLRPAVLRPSSERGLRSLGRRVSCAMDASLCNAQLGSLKKSGVHTDRPSVYFQRLLKAHKSTSCFNQHAWSIVSSLGEHSQSLRHALNSLLYCLH
jgi:hypothetical protein